jgi:hypothetical protein
VQPLTHTRVERTGGMREGEASSESPKGVRPSGGALAVAATRWVPAAALPPPASRWAPLPPRASPASTTNDSSSRTPAPA